MQLVVHRSQRPIMTTEFEPPSPAQLRAARALLGWSRPDLAKAARISNETVNRAEGVRRDPAGPGALMKICAALEKAGVEFLPAKSGGPRVRMKEVEAADQDSWPTSPSDLPTPSA